MQNSGPAFTLTSPPAGGTGTVTASGVEMPVGTTATFTLVVNVNASAPAGTVIANTAAVTTPVDPTDVNNSDTETTTVGQPDLTLAKAGPASVLAGGIVTWTITLTNDGTAPASSVSLFDSIPVNTTFVSFQQTSGPAFVLTTPPAGGTGVASATISSFAAGATATFQLTVEVNSNVAAGTAITNTATVTSTTPDANPADNTDAAVTNIEAAAPPAPIPTASTWMLIALASALTLAAAMKLRS